jgi:hypothetical protein
MEAVYGQLLFGLRAEQLQECGIPVHHVQRLGDGAARSLAQRLTAKEKDYEYQYLFCRGSGHGVGNARAQFLPHAIEWVWKGSGAKKDK